MARLLALLVLMTCSYTASDAAARSRKVVTFAAVGHIVIGTDFPAATPFLPPDSGLGLVDHVAPLLSTADLAFGNLAAPLSARGKAKPWADGVRSFAFRTPQRYAHVLAKLGLDVVLGANNHIHDFGDDAFADTMALLGRMGIGHVGLVDEVHVERVRGISVAFVGFTQPYRPEYQSHHDIAAAGEVVRALGEAYDLVVVMVHGGGEGRNFMHVSRGKEYGGSEYRGRIVDFARHAVDMGADLVVGYGAHHPRAMEYYHGRLIAYSLGNFLTYGPFDLKFPNYLSAVLQVSLAKSGELVEAQVVPLRLKFPGVPSFDAKQRTLKFLRRMSKKDFPESALEIRADGTLAPRPTFDPKAVGVPRLEVGEAPTTPTPVSVTNATASDGLAGAKLPVASRQ